MDLAGMSVRRWANVRSADFLLVVVPFAAVGAVMVLAISSKRVMVEVVVLSS